MRVSLIFLTADDVKMFKAKITGSTARILMCVMIAQEKMTRGIKYQGSTPENSVGRKVER